MQTSHGKSQAGDDSINHSIIVSPLAIIVNNKAFVFIYIFGYALVNKANSTIPLYVLFMIVYNKCLLYYI